MICDWYSTLWLVLITACVALLIVNFVGIRRVKRNQRAIEARQRAIQREQSLISLGLIASGVRMEDL